MIRTETRTTIAENIELVIKTSKFEEDRKESKLVSIERKDSNFTLYCNEDTHVPTMFEHNEVGDDWGGGIWIKGKKVTDYDGVSELPRGVLKTLRALGYDVSEVD